MFVKPAIKPMDMRFCTCADVCKPELIQDAIINDLGISGFREDYLVLHSLIRLWHPNTIVEVGTNLGRGTKIIKNAAGSTSTVYSLDLPQDVGSELATEYVGEKVGSLCDLPYTQLWGDSRTYDFKSIGIIDAFYIDGEHTYDHVYAEAMSASSTGASLIIFHDSDFWDIFKGISDVFYFQTGEYQLCRVHDTRIMFAKRRDVPWMF